MPAEVLQNFQKQSDLPVSFQLAGQIQSIFQQLQRWQQPAESSGFSWGRLLPWAQPEESIGPNALVSLGDYWLEEAIAQNLIDPIELSQESLEPLPPAWQQFTRRGKDGQMTSQLTEEQATTAGQASQLWAVPYRVQTLVIVYRQSFFPKSSPAKPPFQSWQDLLQPQLRQQIALPEHPRLVMGLLQKLQNGSFNLPLETAATSQLHQQLKAAFTELNAQVKTYDSTNALKALVNKDVKAVVAWSGDVVPALRRYQDLKIIVPAEGSLLSADLWVRPRGADMTEAAKRWIEFCWQRGPATQISSSGRGISPVFLSESAEIPDALAESIVPVSALQNSEPLLPIPEATATAYFDLWQQLRSS